MRQLLILLTHCAWVLVTGCGSQTARSTSGGNPSVDLSEVHRSLATLHSDAEKVRAADYSILFVGNSHTTYHGLPNLVARMIEHTHPGKTAYTHVLPVMFLRQTADDSRVPEEIDGRPWKFVVLQAQEISQSGMYEYSRKEGIDLARRAKARGAEVLFFSEWGRRDVPGDGEAQEKVYRAMAGAAGVSVCPIGQAWDLALTQRPGLALHDRDGNHQSALGAYLTACMLYGSITGQSPGNLAAFPFEHVSDSDRQFLARVATTIHERRSLAPPRQP